MTKEFQVGDRVRFQLPARCELAGVVMETDYHPLDDSYVKVSVTDDVLVPFTEWVDVRYVFAAE